MRGSRQAVGLLFAAAVSVPGLLARADILQNIAVDADPLSLLAAGFGDLDGAGVDVGIVEAGGFANASYGNGAANVTAPGSNLPNGNPDLPGAQINFTQLAGGDLPLGANAGMFPNGPAYYGYANNNYAIGNHATEVTGVVMGQGTTTANDIGIAPSSLVNFASLSGNYLLSPTLDNDAAAQITSVLQVPNTHIVNMSWGFYQYQQANVLGAPLYLTNTGGAGALGNPAVVMNAAGVPTPVYQLNAGGNLIANNNGSSLVSRFVDWAATRYDALMVVAGNETPDPSITPLPGNPNEAIINGQDNTTGAPSDSYNSINVGSTGQRGTMVFNAGTNTWTFTAQNGANTALYYGVASTYNRNNVTSDVSPITGLGRLKTDIVAPGGDPASLSQLYPKVGGGINIPAGYQGTLAAAPANGFVNQFESTAGGIISPANGIIQSSSDTYNSNGAGGAYVDASTGSSYIQLGAGAIVPAGTVVPTTIAGTSFAAPLVSGAASLLNQYGNNQGFSTDHRVIKAILLNGATHTYDNAPLMESDGVTPWTRVPGAGVTPLLAGTTQAQFGGSNPLVRPGLDSQLGAGMLNVTNSLSNYAAGQQGPGLVNPTGWNLDTVPAGTPANVIVDAYTINVPVSGLFKATLCWDAPVSIDQAGPEDSYYAPISTLTRGTLTDLDLYIFHVNANGTLGDNEDYSTSDIDNVEYLYDCLPEGTYQIDVANAQFAAPQDTTYGLAWTVPEPTAGLLVLGAGALLAWRRRRRVA